MNVEEQLQLYLEKYINQTIVDNERGVYFVKELVCKIKNMKIEIYPKEHVPPHFHVKSKDRSINAYFSIDDCMFIKGRISNNNLKRIEAFFDDPKTKALLIKFWDKNNPDMQILQ
jgi:hypothetical protein